MAIDVGDETLDTSFSLFSPVSALTRCDIKSKAAKNARPARTRTITQAINQTVNVMNASNIRNNIKPIVKNGAIKKSIPLVEKQTKKNNIYMNESDNEYSIGCIEFDSNGGKVSKSKTENNMSDTTSNKNFRKSADKIVDKTSDKMGDKNTSKIAVKTTDKITDKTTDKTADKTADKTTDKSTDKIADKMSGCGTPSSGGNWSTKWFGGLLRTRPKRRPVRGRARLDARRNESRRPPVVAPTLNAFPSGHRFGRLVESTSADMFPLTNALSFASLSPLSSSLSREIPRTSSIRRSRSLYSHSNGRNDKLWAISLKCRQWLRAENHRYQLERQRRSRGNSPYPAMTRPSAPIPFGAFCYQTKAPIRFIIGHMDITLSTPSPVRFSFITEELFIQRQLEARNRENQSNRFLIHHGKIFRSPFFLTDMERLAVAPNHRKYTLYVLVVFAMPYNTAHNTVRYNTIARFFAEEQLAVARTLDSLTLLSGRSQNMCKCVFKVASVNDDHVVLEMAHKHSGCAAINMITDGSITVQPHPVKNKFKRALFKVGTFLFD